MSLGGFCPSEFSAKHAPLVGGSVLEVMRMFCSVEQIC